MLNNKKMKKCPNNHDNPDDAKFCRICGHSFDKPSLWDICDRYFNATFAKLKSILSQKATQKGSCTQSTFTPDAFPSITFSPCSVANVNFEKSKGLKAIIVYAIIILFILVSQDFIVNTIIFKFCDTIGIYHYVHVCNEIYTYGSYIVVMLCLILLIRKIIPTCKIYTKWLLYVLNADYIESRAFVNNYSRIAKNCKLGLFDKSSNCVMLRSCYDNITVHDKEYLLVEKNSKYGLYSLKKSSMIIPVRYNKISGFVNSIATCNLGSTIHHYDVNGNKLK